MPSADDRCAGRPTGQAGLRRGDFPLVASKTYLDSCSLGSLSKLSYSAMRSYADQCDRYGAASWFAPDGFLDMLDAMRGNVAELIGAHRHEVGLAPNVSVALASLTSALLGPGDRVVTTDLDFPSLVLGLRARQRLGVEVSVLAAEDRHCVPPQAFAEGLERPAKLLATSRVLYGSGVVQDVRQLTRLAHQRGALTLIDDYQATGQLPVDVHELGIDFLVGGSMKWLCGGTACAFYYVREDLIECLEPTIAGWFGVEDQLEFHTDCLRWRTDARRFELGTPSLISVGLANAGMQMIKSIGLAAIREQNTALVSYLVARMEAAGHRPRVYTPAAEHSALVLIDIDSRPDLDKLVARLLTEHGVIVDARNGALRVSPHFYNDTADIDRLDQAVAACISR
jgi:kynureninase